MGEKAGVDTLRVLVTGATGTVGGSVAQRLSRDPRIEVHAVVRKRTAFPSNVIQRVVDLEDPKFARRLEDVEYDCVVHAAQLRDWSAASASSEPFDLRVVRQLDVLCTERTKRRIYTSGVWIYGHQSNGEVIDERSRLAPISLGQNRLKTLQYLRGESSGRWVEIVLPSLVYGDVRPFAHLVEAVRAGTSVVVDDASILWSLVERSDLADAYHRLVCEGYDESLFLVAEPDAVAVLEVYRLVASTLGARFAPVSRSALAATLTTDQIELITCNQPADSSLIRMKLGWSPLNSFASSFRQFVR